MRLDRELQKRILEGLRQIYPENLKGRYYLLGSAETDADLKANIAYLCEHGLVQSALVENGQQFIGRWYNSVKITAKGLDFLEQDGGLSAIFGIVTIKFHADTIRDLLEANVMNSGLPPAEKRRFVDTLKELPSEVLKTITNKLVEKACESPQVVIDVLANFMN